MGNESADEMAPTNRRDETRSVHQLDDPGSPLNGPTTSGVIQPP
jgi:hypothetical protein